MSYADNLLSRGETIELRERQHWIILAWGARFAAVALVIALVVLVIRSNLSRDLLNGALGSILGWIVLGLFVYGLLHFGWMTLRYLNQEYVLTNRRVVQVEGVINKRTTDSSLEKINDAVLSQAIVGRLLGFGDLDILTAAEAGIERFRMIRNPIEFKKAMLNAKHDYEIDMNRAPGATSPPIRASAGQSGPTSTPAETVAAAGASPAAALPSIAPAPPPAASVAPPAPVAAPAPPQAPRMSADEVTRTLANLADLRDRGAVTAEEYEAKKADLLSRI